MSQPNMVTHDFVTPSNKTCLAAPRLDASCKKSNKIYMCRKGFIWLIEILFGNNFKHRMVNMKNVHRQLVQYSCRVPCIGKVACKLTRWVLIKWLIDSFRLNESWFIKVTERSPEFAAVVVIPVHHLATFRMLTTGLWAHKCSKTSSWNVWARRRVSHSGIGLVSNSDLRM
jgi:hypothetical protein